MRGGGGGGWAVLVVLAGVAAVTAVEYTNQFAVVVAGGRERAARAAAKHGCSLVDSIGDLTDHYLFECHTVHKRSTQHSQHHTDRLRETDEILWADQQYYKTRRKRDGAGDSGGLTEELLNEISDSGPSAAGPLRRATLKEDPPPAPQEPPPQTEFRRSTAADYWPDPLFKEQWYLNGGARDGSDMNVLPAWQQGYRGQGVVVSILDDGIQPNHPDLAANYDGRASLDINDDDDDPTPRDDGFNRHGTRCAGEVAAIAGNQYCGVGVAPNASIGGVRMLDGGVNDYVEAKALSYRRNYIDVYSASWGPEDDGKTVDGPGPLARRAFIEGVLKGRGGKGSIFVWASGNGGRYVDNCNCDGYTNSIFTLSISSATQGGKKPWYLEECASTLATTYSSGLPSQDKSIATCDQDAALRPKHICTVSHTGTSASAPLAAGIIALTLGANPNLTWRDMQYITLMTSRPEPLAHELGWLTNGVGRKVSHKFGYGLMDAGAMVDLARRWHTVPTQHICITPLDSRTRRIPAEEGGELHTSMEVNACQGSPQSVNFLEHVQCKVTLTHVPRGGLRILLSSPSGTVSTLLFERPQDVLGSSFDRWPFMSVHFWGERPEGVWNLTVVNTKAAASAGTSSSDSVLKEWQLILYGTEQEPVHLTPAEQGTGSNGGAGHAAVVSRSEDSSPGVYCSRSCVLACQSQPAADMCKRCRDHYKSPCQRWCDPGTYYGGEAGCQPCHATCATCLGRLANQCMDCAAGHYLIADLSVCVPACPDGYFTANETCQSCGPHCTACDGSANHCVSCAPHLFLHNSQCVASCPAGTYRLQQRCERCADGCMTCIGPNDNNCVLCRRGLFHFNGQCVNSCPPGRQCGRP
ncbi:furin-like protease 2 [Amphibalanus amphitrite]|uniref:furin-like protease 2 n=1 Tax=Amphibalanus amphitrite TaxID=1232801 RepID=UPI001C903BE0|nr:furin-like protease 2 [Amphibalanus amphitrite]XP_043199029.1 furin-like protease 2 [Amphibalanus amphitrite]